MQTAAISTSESPFRQHSAPGLQVRIPVMTTEPLDNIKSPRCSSYIPQSSRPISSLVQILRPDIHHITMFLCLTSASRCIPIACHQSRSLGDRAPPTQPLCTEHMIDGPSMSPSSDWRFYSRPHSRSKQMCCA